MSLKEQWETLKDNWLLAILFVVIVLFFSNAGSISQFESFSSDASMKSGDYAPMMARAEFMPSPRGDFAPEVKDRLIAKSAQLSSEVERSTFGDASEKLKSAITANNAFLLNENVNTYERGARKEYRVGYYTIKVETSKYSNVLSQLKGMGKVLSFSENAEDITGSFTNLQAELDAEKKRLQRYNAMQASAVSMEDKINLVDRIFNLESRIKYLEDSVSNLGKQVSFSTIHVTLTEKRFEYADIEFVKLSALVSGFVGSLNSLVSLVVALLPWAVAVWLVVVVMRFFRKGKK